MAHSFIPPHGGLLRKLLPRLSAIILLGILAACGAEQKIALRGAVKAGEVPIYPGAKYESAMGGTTSEGFDGPAISRSMSWFFKVDDPVEDVVAFYEKEWIGAVRDEEKSEDYTEDVIFKGTFDDAQEGEYLSVSISEGSLQITEVLNPERFPEE